MTLLDTAELAAIPGPFELLELADGTTMTLRVERWEIGKATINPRDGRAPQLIPVLRVHVPAADKRTLPAWWDITSKHLIAGLLGYLEAGPAPWPAFKITWYGRGPRGRPSLETIPTPR